jgi:RND family efflux transporter MFP subunit
MYDIAVELCALARNWSRAAAACATVRIMESSRPWIIAALAGLYCASCSGADATGANREEGGSAQTVAVEVLEARQGAVPLSERLTGTVRASGEVAIYPETSGPVVEVFAENGDAVRRGAPLVRIRASGSKAQLDQARSNLEAAQADLRRSEARLQELERQLDRLHILIERGLLSRSELDAQQALVDTARAERARASAQVAAERAGVAERTESQDQTLVRAPISGRIGQRNVEVGMLVNPQTPLFVIGRLEQVRVEVPVSQEILTRVRSGQTVEIRAGDSIGDPIEARVSRISPFLQEGSFSAEIEIDIANHGGRLVPGMFVTVDLFYGQSEEATLVPTSALFNDPTTGEQGVFVSTVEPAAIPDAESDELYGELSDAPVAVRFQRIEILAEGAQTAGIDGVRPGEWVVVVGQHLLANQAGRGEPQARIRAIAWDRVMALQGLQREDLLRQFMERQQELAAGAGQAGNP